MNKKCKNEIKDYKGKISNRLSFTVYHENDFKVIGVYWDHSPAWELKIIIKCELLNPASVRGWSIAWFDLCNFFKQKIASELLSAFFSFKNSSNKSFNFAEGKKQPTIRDRKIQAKRISRPVRAKWIANRACQSWKNVFFQISFFFSFF